MNADRGYCVLVDPDQWLRCAHRSTALLDGGGVQLTWLDETTGTAATGTAATGAGVAGAGVPDLGEPGGLAFDAWCRAYRSAPHAGRVEIFEDTTGGVVRTGASAPQGDRQVPEGLAVHVGAMRTPRGIAVDSRHFLYVTEAGAGAVDVVDLESRRLRRRIPLRSRRQPRRRPVDVATGCCTVVVLVHGPLELVRIEGRRGPLPGPRIVRPPGAGGLTPQRVTLHEGSVVLLWARSRPSGNGAADSRSVVAYVDGSAPQRVDGATDLDVTTDGVLVVATRPDGLLRRFRPHDGGDVDPGWDEIEPLAAPGYDGGAVAVAPDGRIAFTTAWGVGWATGPSIAYEPRGTVTSYRLDSGTYRTRWGRVFLDACLPAGTSVTVRFVTSDDDTVDDPLPASPPDRGVAAVAHPEATPPLPSRSRLAERDDPRPVHRRVTGREWPWAQIDADDAFETYEAPVNAPPGRYLWAELELTGSTRSTPRVRAVRVERPGHRLLEQLPHNWSRQEPDADFLQRFLAPAEGLLHEFDERADQRDALLDPATAPQEALAWIAGLVGLTLDRRWSEAARRAIIAEAYPLYRIRGTQVCLERILDLYLGYRHEVQAIENWRLRGLGGAVLGTAPGGPPAPSVGGAASTSGALGRFVLGATGRRAGYARTAHRFTVLIPATLTADQRDVVRSVLDSHKPAHTVADVCELGTGMRIGRQAHVQLTTLVGAGSWWGRAVVGQSSIGTDRSIGLAAVGSRLGDTTITGQVRVG